MIEGDGHVSWYLLGQQLFQRPGGPRTRHTGATEARQGERSRIGECEMGGSGARSELVRMRQGVDARAATFR